jgi:hypothetical protein
MNLHTDLCRATPPAAVATVPRRRRGTAFVAVSPVALLAIGVGVAVAQIADGGSRSVAQPTTPAPAVRVPPGACNTEIDNLLATVEAMPPTVVASLSPDLIHFIEGSVIFGQSPFRLPAPDTATIGRVLAQLDRADRNVIMAGAPAQQQPAVAAAEAEMAAALFAVGAVAVCF